MSFRFRKMMKSAARLIRRPLMRRVRRHGLILLYHRIAETQNDPWNLCVAPAHFRQHLEVLTAMADVVPLAEFTHRLQFARGRRATVAITFDDGYLDNYSEALPSLQTFSAPATIFIATGAVGREEPFWWDVLAEAVTAATLPPEIELQIGSSRFHWRSAKTPIMQDDRHALHEALWARLQAADEVSCRNAVDAFCTRVGFDPQQLRSARAMNIEELRRVEASGLIELGAHTISHCPLPKRDVEERRREIQGSRRQLEALLGRAPVSFAYPYGEVDAISRDLVAESGFERACSTTEDLVWEGKDPLLLSRFSVPDVDGAAFERRLRHVWLG